MTDPSFEAVPCRALPNFPAFAASRAITFSAIICVLILNWCEWAHASATIQDMGYYRVGTTLYYANSFPGCYAFSSCCTAPNCLVFTTDGQSINTSDLTAGLDVIISSASDGEAFTFQAVAPDGSLWLNSTLTYTAATGCWSWTTGATKGYGLSLFEGPPSQGGSGNCPGASVQVWSGPELPCFYNRTPLAGTWKLQLFDNANPGTPVLSHTFMLQHDSGSQFGITSPVFNPNQNNAVVDNALIDLAEDQNFTATDSSCPAPVNGQGKPTSVCFSAETSNNVLVNWQLQLQYATSGGLAQIYDPNEAFLTFTTSSSSSQNHIYTNEGGQLTDITGSTVASDGSTVQDCTNAYIEGPAGGITNSVITSQLEQSPQSYPNSSSYPSGGTPSLLAQAAVYESGYAQFLEPPQPPKNFDLYNLFAKSSGEIAAKWPLESRLSDGLSDGGSHIGLLQVMTDANQSTDPNAWNWVTNATDGVNLFSGDPPAEYQDNNNKIDYATTYENEIIQEGYTPQLPNLSSTQLENMALLLYGPGASVDLTKQYYAPSCSGKIVKQFTCKGANWVWKENTNNPTGTTYVDTVRAENVPQ